jgi:putative flavoprotein involved in K+ transport
MGTQQLDTVVIGGGQAGLAMGYHLARQGRRFVILDAEERTGDAWRKRWDSLRLFTPRRYDGLPGMRMPGKAGFAPTKDEMADYLEAYATRFALPVHHSSRVDSLTHDGSQYVVACGDERYLAATVVIATGAHQRPVVPAVARELDPRIVQLHSTEYRGPQQLQPGGVLLVGGGNSGADIAMEVVQTHPTWLVGRHPGHVPFHIDTFAARHVLVRGVRFVGQHVLSWRTPIGRKALPKMRSGGAPLIRVKPKDLLAAGVTRVTERVVGVQDGLPKLANGETLDVTNVIWCTGSHPELGWVRLPVFDEDGRLRHRRGVVEGQPGLYAIGLEFLWSATSGIVTGLGRDTAYLARQLRRGPRASVPVAVAS